MIYRRQGTLNGILYVSQLFSSGLLLRGGGLFSPIFVDAAENLWL